MMLNICIENTWEIQCFPLCFSLFCLCVLSKWSSRRPPILVYMKVYSKPWVILRIRPYLTWGSKNVVLAYVLKVFRSIPRLLRDLKMRFQLMYVRFWLIWEPHDSFTPGPENMISAYIRKVFLCLGTLFFAHLETKSVVFAYVYKVFLHVRNLKLVGFRVPGRHRGAPSEGTRGVALGSSPQ